MRDIVMSGTYTGPPKYLSQRDQPLEIPMDCVRKLCDAIDLTYSERCSLLEIQHFIEKKELPFEDGIVPRMYEEATSGRGYICDS